MIGKTPTVQNFLQEECRRHNLTNQSVETKLKFAYLSYLLLILVVIYGEIDLLEIFVL